MGLSCDMWDHQSSLRHVGFLAVAWGAYFPEEGLNLGPCIGSLLFLISVQDLTKIPSFVVVFRPHHVVVGF